MTSSRNALCVVAVAASTCLAQTADFDWTSRGSGVEWALESGKQIASVVGPEFDIVGFDPRGTSFSTPLVSWFASDAERSSWLPGAASTVFWQSVNQTTDALAHMYARAQIEGRLAEARNTEGFLQYITTDYTARDMLTITEAFGFEKVQYWGVSYGSVLGATFAAMFPDKPGPGHAHSTTTPRPVAEIASSLDAVLASIQQTPLPVFLDTSSSYSYAIVDYTFVKSTIFNAFYQPAATRQRYTSLPLATDTAVFSCDPKAAPLPHDYESEMAGVIRDGAWDTKNFADLWADWRVMALDGRSPQGPVSQGPFWSQDWFAPSLVIGNYGRPCIVLGGRQYHREHVSPEWIDDSFNTVGLLSTLLVAPTTSLMLHLCPKAHLPRGAFQVRRQLHAGILPRWDTALRRNRVSARHGAIQLDCSERGSQKESSCLGCESVQVLILVGGERVNGRAFGSLVLHLFQVDTLLAQLYG
ncbi:hypothetical protein B0H14DRAFT_2658115 [Mycena olivaceomarginata]|nr:hypothetical protein B0H14DRAFT_2658115 [Mycena olivaceomarginata]